MQQDWRLKSLGLNAQGELSREAVRAAYWRALAQARREGRGLDQLQQAKRELLFELGLRLPPGKGR